MNLNSGPKNSPLCQIWAWSSNYLENNSSFFVFSTPKMTWHAGNKRLLWQHLITMVIDKIREMTVKGVKLKSESFFLISPGVLELWRKNLRGAESPPLCMDRVNDSFQILIFQNFFNLLGVTGPKWFDFMSKVPQVPFTKHFYWWLTGATFWCSLQNCMTMTASRGGGIFKVGRCSLW